MKTLCPGCAFGMWYNWGALCASSAEEVFVAISGSTLSVACFLCNLNVEEEIQKCLRYRKNIMFDFRNTLRSWLTESLPIDCHTQCEGKLIVLCREFPSYKLKTFSSWRHKEHFIETLIAACCPFFPHSVDGVWYTDCLYVYKPETYLCTEKKLISKLVLLPPTSDFALELYKKGYDANVVKQDIHEDGVVELSGFAS